uniref:Bromodomain-containing protein 8 n=1 Tax=Oryzias sinensis TaxID=183150 RepID=A0A8C7YCW3_9TELE
LCATSAEHKLLVIGPTEPWTVREKLCLATSVMKSGDQNWVSVSRAIKPFAEPGRPPDWFSQKHCASKYSELLETTEAPKRKRGEKGEVVETIEDVIVRRLTAERIEELKRFIKETQEKHRQLKREAELIQAGHLDSKLEELWQEILRKKKQEEEEAELKRKTTDAAFQARQVAKSMPKRTSSVTMNSPSACGSPSQELPPGDPAESLTLDDARNEENAPETKAESSVEEPEVCGEEEGYGIEGFLSEPDGDLELQPAASESEDGCSLHTASSSLQLHAVADSIPSSPASSQFSVCSEDLEALQAHRIWKKAIMLVWRAAANHRYANVFLQPVTDEIAPGYHRIVHRPMDLATLKKNIETGLIRTTAEFQRDIMLMFQNAVMYNGLDHDVYHMALEMQRDVMEQIQQFLATQLIMETSESGISSKSLRGRESTHKQDSTDKDTVSMSSPAFLLSLFDGGTRGRRSAIQADLKMKK